MKVVLVTTKLKNHHDNGESEYLHLKEVNKYQSLFTKIIEADEQIDKNGSVIVELQERVINGILREIYSAKPEVVIIALYNSSKNPVHEKTFEHLLQVAGYKSVYVSYKPNALISFLNTLSVSHKI